MPLFPKSSSSAAAATVTSMFRNKSPVTKRHGESRAIRTHPLHLFRIIQDVDRYQEFLPLCRYSKVDYSTIRENGRSFQAALRVGQPPLFSEEYVSQVRVEPEILRVATESIQSQQHMFDALKSSWQLKRVDLENDGDDDEELRIDENHNSTMNKESRRPQSFPPSSMNTYSNIACHVDFEVEMTVSNPAVVAILDQVLMKVAGSQVEAFDTRCQDLPWPWELIEEVERRLQ